MEEILEDLAIALERERKAREAAEALLEEKAVEFSRLNESLNQRNKDLENTSFIISHDLKQPANSIARLAKIILNHENIPKTVRASAQHIADSGERMRALVEDLLDYARLGKDSVPGMLDCNKILEDVCMDLSSTIEDTGASIDSDDLPIVFGYGTELRLLFQNLVSNAIKFHKPGQPPSIRIASEERNDSWLFTVTDNGLGIPDKKKETIFTIFSKAHQSSEIESTGIGLAHCRKIAELHHGRIWVTSEINKGSTFHFTIQKNSNYETETKNDSAH